MRHPLITRKERRQELFNQLHNSDDEMHRVSAVHLEMIFEYYDDVLKQAKISFLSAVVLAILGFGVLIATVYIVMKDPSDAFGVGTIGVVSGGLVEFLSAIAFFIYKRATEQFNSFHVCLERTNRYLMAYNIDEMIDGKDSIRDQARHELAIAIANAPMITQKESENAPIIRSALLQEAFPTDRREQLAPSSDDMLQPQRNQV
jgi:hypothetical protein